MSSDDEAEANRSDYQVMMAEWQGQTEGKRPGESTNVFVMWKSGLTSLPDAAMRKNMLMVLDLRCVQCI
jgi:hypothetical protein